MTAMQGIEVRGLRYAYEQHGDAGPLVLFGHGLYFDRTMFAPVASALSDRCRCVCIDWPGHGGSSGRPGGWTVDDLVQDVAALIGAFGAERAVLVGLSQGAAVFTRVALKHPALVQALVLMDATPEQPPEAARQRVEAASATLEGGDEGEVSELLSGVVQRMFSPATHEHRPELPASAQACIRRHSRGGLAQAVRLPLSYRSVTQQLPSLAMPTLVLWGEDDQSSPIALLEHYRAIPGATVQTFPDAGHLVALERPADVSHAIREFLAANHLA